MLLSGQYLCVQIHGGITDQDVTKFVEYAEQTAQTNKAVNSRLSTVVFFDEANTTESIGLIKEIMCDQRINGRSLSTNLKFIAACNPYRKLVLVEVLVFIIPIPCMHRPL